MLLAPFCCRGSGTVCAVAVSGTLLAFIPPFAWGQATGQPQPTETDIGRVTTAPGQGQNESVLPSSTTTRAAAIEEKKQAPNIIDVQPLSEIIKLPDINMAEALQRVPGISLETDSGEGRFINIRGLDSNLNASTYAGAGWAFLRKPVRALRPRATFFFKETLALTSAPRTTIVPPPNRAAILAETQPGTPTLAAARARLCRRSVR
jgi:TonB-dependent Receptor Plug Domain